MKTQLLFAALFAASFTAFAQVGIGTQNPQGALDVVSVNSGILYPRVATITDITTPIDGMLAYAIDQKCFKGYQDGAWEDVTTGTPAGPTSPQPTLDAVPTTDIVSPRVATIGAIAKPIDGMQAFATDQKCFKVYQNDAWKDTTPCTAISADKTASGGINNGVSSVNSAISAINTNLTTKQK